MRGVIVNNNPRRGVIKFRFYHIPMVLTIVSIASYNDYQHNRESRHKPVVPITKMSHDFYVAANKGMRDVWAETRNEAATIETSAIKFFGDAEGGKAPHANPH